MMAREITRVRQPLGLEVQTCKQCVGDGARSQNKSRVRSSKGMVWAWEAIQPDRFWAKAWGGANTQLEGAKA